MQMRSSKALLGFCIAALAAFTVGCGGGGTSALPPPPPSPSTISITAVSPTTVNTGQTLTITYTGPDPAATGNSVVATFKQGNLPSKQGKFLGANSLGANQFRAFYQVPSGLASDFGIIPVPSILTLSNSQVTSAAQNILIAPPPFLVLFPEELYRGDSNVSVRIHGNGTHFDQSTVVSGSGGIQVTGTTVLAKTELMIVANVTATTAGISTIMVSSGGSDSKTTEVLSALLPIAAPPSALIGASKLSRTDGPPGGIIQVQGLFNPPESLEHNVVTWTLAGFSVQTTPLAETSSTLQIMVPIWPNGDGSLYSGPAQVRVRASGNSSQFDFTIDPLPSNPNARGVVFNALLDSLTNSIPTLQSSLTAVSSSPESLAAFQAVTGDALSIISKLRGFVNAEISGNAASPPGTTMTITPQQFDLAERILLSSGLFQQVSSPMALAEHFLRATNASDPSGNTTEQAMLRATNVCRNLAKSSEIIQKLHDYFLNAALVDAGQGHPLEFAVYLTLAFTASSISFVPELLNTVCETFPIGLTNISLTPIPPAQDPVSLATTGTQAASFKVVGKFQECANVTAVLTEIINEALGESLDRQFEVEHDPTLLALVSSEVLGKIAGEVLSVAQDLLSSAMEKYLNLNFTTPISGDVELTSATVSLFSDNQTIALAIPESLTVHAIAPGTTAVHADLHHFDLLLISSSPLGGTCRATQNSRDIPGNSAQIKVDGPPLVISTNSGGSTGVIPGTLNGNPVDKAYVAVPDANVVSVLDADAQAGSPPITTIPMPSGFSPTATAANPLTSQVFVISYTSPVVLLIDAKTDKVNGALTLPVTHIASFSGGACMVCGVVADVLANQIIFDTADGYFILDLKSGQIQTISAHAAENFGYNPFTRQLVNPFYGAPFFSPIHGVDLIDLKNGSVTPVGNIPDSVFKPDSAAIDYTTNIAVVANEAESTPPGVLAFLNLQAARNTGSQANVPLATFTFPDASSVCSGGVDSSEWTMLAVDAATHLLFFANEFSDCLGVLNLPPIGSDGVPRVASTVRFGEVPMSPDGQAWANSLDPHGTAVFVSVIDGRSYGFLVRKDAHYVARIDLQKLFAAQVLAGTHNVVDLHSLVAFLRTLPNEP